MLKTECKRWKSQLRQILFALVKSVYSVRERLHLSLFFTLLFLFSSLPSFYIFLSLLLQCSLSWYMIQHSAESQTWPHKTFYCQWNEKNSCSDAASLFLKLLSPRLTRCQQSSPEKESFFPLRINKGSCR